MRFRPATGTHITYTLTLTLALTLSPHQAMESSKKRLGREAVSAGSMPQKRFYRQRAHANPFSDHNLRYPAAPSLMDWSVVFPQYCSGGPGETATQLQRPVEVLDVGCGFGGLLVALAPLMPTTLMLGKAVQSKRSLFWFSVSVSFCFSAFTSFHPIRRTVCHKPSLSHPNSPHTLLQASRSAPKWPNTCKNASERCGSNTRRSTKTPAACAPTR